MILCGIVRPGTASGAASNRTPSATSTAVVEYSATRRHGSVFSIAIRPVTTAIHTDLQKGFINCEIISWAEYGKWKNYREAQSRAPKRVEGKAYVMQDFDLIEVKSGL